MVSGRPLILYTAAGCSLCEAVMPELEAAAALNGLALEVIDIASEPALERRYRFAIPVVMLGGTEIARAPIRPGTIDERLRMMLA